MNRREILTALPVALVATSAVAAEPSRPLSARGEANLTAYARLIAYVRFFHPSDEAAATDWNAFVVSNVEAVEAAATPAELVQRLDAVFRPIAPTMTLGLAGKAAPAVTPPTGPGTLVMWKHRGVGLPSPKPNPTYRSQRIPVPDGQPKVVKLDLGGGVVGAMPTTAYSALDAKPPTPTPVNAFSGDDRKVRLANVMIAWGVLQHFYPYFDAVDCDWNAELSKALRAAATDPDASRFRVTLAHMVAALHDGHGNVNSRQPLTILPVGWSWIEDRLVITALPADAPPGLAVGGVVMRIDGVDIRDRVAELETEACAATPQWRRFKALQLLQRRRDGSPALLEGEAPDGKPFKVQLTGGAPEATRGLDPRLARANFSEPRPGVLYVDLARVTEQDLTDKMAQLVAAKGVVLDDRGYPTNPAHKLVQHFSDRTVRSSRFDLPTFTAPDRRNVTYEDVSWTLAPTAPRLSARLVLLTGGGSISYAESWAGVFENERFGAIVGGPTAGTNGDINWMMLPGGYSFIFTGLRVTKPDGSRHHGVGIIPTVPVSQTLAGVRAGRDEVLERGVAVALGEA